MDATMSPRQTALLPIVLATLLVGCNSSTPLGGTPRKSYINQVVSLSPSTSEICASSGVTRLLGRTSSCDWPPMTFNSAKVVVKGIVPDYEAIAALKPQLVLYDNALYGDAEISKIEQLGVKTLALDSSSFEGYEKYVKDFASTVGTETTASEYLDKVYANLDVLQSTLTEPSKVCVISGDSTGYVVAGLSTFVPASLKRAGITPVGPESRRWEPASIEQIAQWNPDYIVTTKSTVKALVSDPKMAAIPAIKAERILGIEDNMVLRAGGRVDALYEILSTGLGRLAELRAK